MKKNILLTGASGTVGFEVLKQLVLRPDYTVTAFDVENHQAKKKLASVKEKFKIIYGDLTDEGQVAAVTKNLDAAIHLAAIIPPIADEKPEFAEKVNVRGTENLIKSLEKNSPDAFFLYSSSISVYGDRLKNPEISVGDALVPSMGDAYAVTKIKAEKMIRNCKLDWSIFRLAAIMGNHKISKLMFHMPLETSMEICTPADTARAFVHALEHKNELNKKTFNLGGGENCRISYRDFLTKSFDIFGMGKLDFPEKAFAEKNFHCGNYADGDDLERILHFRRDSLDDYFRHVKSGVNPVVRGLTAMASPLIKRRLLKQSEPYEAFHKNDTKLTTRFFN